MPRYLYKCNNCDARIDAWHGMSDEEQIKDCEVCGCVDCVVRLPSSFIYDKQDASHKAGDHVKKAINNFAEDLRREKQNLKNEYYEDHD